MARGHVSVGRSTPPRREAGPLEAVSTLGDAAVGAVGDADGRCVMAVMRVAYAPCAVRGLR